VTLGGVTASPRWRDGKRDAGRCPGQADPTGCGTSPWRSGLP
jgi:hypothetical protein